MVSNQNLVPLNPLPQLELTLSPSYHQSQHTQKYALVVFELGMTCCGMNSHSTSVSEFLVKQYTLAVFQLLADANCHVDICPNNIYPGEIYSYQEYLRCY